MQNKLYVQYGCGLSAPKEWINFDASSTLRIQKTPILRELFKGKVKVIFPDNVLFGDILKGLPVNNDSCDAVFCSHVLEHLSYEDFQLALRNTYKILKKGGVFRVIVPDLEIAARNYISSLDNNDNSASISFMESTMLGKKSRPRGIKGFLTLFFGNSNHLWMWDFNSLSSQLIKNNFKDIRRYKFNDSSNKLFSLVEDKSRFKNAVAIECIK